MKKQEISWDSPFKDPLSHVKVSRNWRIFGKNGLLWCLDEMSQQSWTKNTQTKCHRLWDKILQWDGLSHCDKPSKFTRSECHNFGWTDNPSTLRRNVTVVKCHSRRFVGWTNSVGRNVTWTVCGWTDRQCTALSNIWCRLPNSGVECLFLQSCMLTAWFSSPVCWMPCFTVQVLYLPPGSTEMYVNCLVNSAVRFYSVIL